MPIAIFNSDGVQFLLRWIHIFFAIIWIGLLYYSNFIESTLTPRALKWFRWSAMFSFIIGLVILVGLYHQSPGVFTNARGVLILIGAVMGTLIWANTWFVAWPNQRVSRTNVVFSIATLFFMAASTHLPLYVNPAASLVGLVIAVAVILGLFELNALKGKLGPLGSITGVIHMGVALAIVLYALTEVLTK